MKAISRTLLILMPFLSAEAAQLSPEQAIRRVEGSSMRFRAPGNVSYRLAYTESAAREARLYVFNKGDDGFVIASADDAFPPVLGYSDCGTFNPSDASPELKWWLSQYAEEAAWYLQNYSGGFSGDTSEKTAKVTRADIPALLSSKWNQGAPYNLDCPEENGQKSVTGCVATAMAQVIRYHGYPTQGKGEHSYSWKNTTLDFDYGNTTFNYSDMLDVYNESASTAQQEAVANLMYACGVSVDMSYSPNESGAGDIYIPYALKTYFNYDAGTRLLKRDYFSIEDWENLVYSELAEGRPVIYGGQASTGGHQFVCDGYENGYFHINWGWGGNSDGYFLLSALNPKDQGIGSYEGGYNSDQAIVYGAIPAQGGTPWYPIYATGALDVTSYNPQNNSVNVSFKNGGIYNYSPESANLSLGIKCVSDSDKEYVSENLSAIDFAGAEGLSMTGFTSIGGLSLPSNLEAGEYKAYLGFKTSAGVWQDVLFPETLDSYFNVTVNSDGTYDLGEGVTVAKANVRVTAFAPSTSVIKGVETGFNISGENTGDAAYSGALTLKLYRKGELEQPLTQTNINANLGAGSSFNSTLKLTLTYAAGEYDVIFYDKENNVISDVFSFEIVDAFVAVTGIVLDATEASMDVDSTLQLNVSVEPADASDKSLTWSSSNPEIATVDATGLVTAYAAGEVTITVKSATSEDISASCKITVKEKIIVAEGVSLDKTAATLTEGETLTLVAAIDPETVTDRTLAWTSSDEDVATVKDGVVTALKAGKATITVTTSNGKTASCEITVIAKEPEIIYVSSITLNQTEAAAIPGTVITLVATVLPENATDKTLLWSSSDEDVATVDADGIVNVKSEGYVVITAISTDGSEIKAECTISSVSWIDAIKDGTVSADVYTINGLLIKSNADDQFLSRLAKGTYIIRVGNVIHKIIK